MQSRFKLLFSFFFFWLFLLLFKFGAGLHFVLLSPLGERLMPLWAIGLVMSIASILQLVLDIPAGNLLDRFGYKRILVIATVISVIGAALLFFNFTIFSFLLSIFLMTIGWLFFGPGKNAYSLSHATKKESTKFMAYRDIFTSAGIVLSCILLPFLVNASNKLISVALSLILVFACIAIFFSPKDSKIIGVVHGPHERTHAQRRHVFKNILLTLKNLNPASSLLILLELSGAIFYGVVWFIVPLMIAASPADAGLLGIGLSMFDFSIIVVGSFICAFVEKSDKKLMIFFGLLLFAVAGMLVGFSIGLLFLVMAFLATTGDEIASIPLWAWLHQLDKKHNKDGLISGTINLFEDLGWAIGPLLAGIIYPIFGAQLSIFVGAIPLLLLLFIYYFIVRKHVISISLFEVPKKPHKHRHKT